MTIFIPYMERAKRNYWRPPLSGLLALANRCIDYRRRRREKTAIQALDDRLLRDIGCTRSEISDDRWRHALSQYCFTTMNTM